MVTWGPNVTHSIGTPAPAPAPFGAAPAPAPTAFGTTATFLNSAPSVFGAAPSPFGGFASPASSAFGASTTPTATASAAATPIPAQAALQAHMDATSRQEESRVTSVLQRIHQSYNGTAPASSNKSAPFCTTVTNPLTPQQQQLQLAAGLGHDARPKPLVPPTPPQMSQTDWNYALSANPHPRTTIPVALVGAPGLQGRLSYHQEWANRLEASLQTIQSSLTTAQQVQERLVEHTAYAQRRTAGQVGQFLNILRKVELIRCLRQPLVKDEGKMVQDLRSLGRGLEHVALPPAVTTPATIVPHSLPPEDQLFRVLQDQRRQLEQVTRTVQRDVRDLQLIQDRVRTKNNV